MRKFLMAVLFCFIANTGLATGIDPSTTEFPWMNGPARDSRYKLSDFPNRVHVWEAFSITCSWCARNAAQVKELKAEYAGDDRVEVIDLGLDTRDSDYNRWIQTHQPTWPVVKDENRTVWTALSSHRGIPQTFVTACDGTLVGATIGYWDAAAKATLRAAIARAKQTVCD
jgi:hypothetical protein